MPRVFRHVTGFDAPLYTAPFGWTSKYTCGPVELPPCFLRDPFSGRPTVAGADEVVGEGALS